MKLTLSLYGFWIIQKCCPVCRQDVEKEKEMKRFGKYRCSEEYAEESRQKLNKEKLKKANRGRGCCGK